MILTHRDGVRLTQSPDPPPEVIHPLGQDTMAVASGPPTCKPARSLGPPGTLERSEGSSPLPTVVPEKAGPSCLHFGSVRFFAGLKARARGEHATLVLVDSVFLVPLRC